MGEIKVIVGIYLSKNYGICSHSSQILEQFPSPQSLLRRFQLANRKIAF